MDDVCRVVITVWNLMGSVFGLSNKRILPWIRGARQVGSGLYHTKVMMTCVASHCDLRNCLKVPFPGDETMG